MSMNDLAAIRSISEVPLNPAYVNVTSAMEDEYIKPSCLSCYYKITFELVRV